MVLGVVVAVLLAMRAAASWDPSMRGWGANSMRFAAPWFGWAPWAVAVLLLVPGVAKRVAPRLAAVGDAMARNAVAARLGIALAAAAMVLALPDRIWLMGDFLLRLGCARGQIPVTMVFPQALPLDLALHHHLPVALERAGLMGSNVWERMLGAVEAGALALAAAALARQLGLKGMAAATATGLIAFSGALSMFTGYGKGFVELTLATVAVAVFALRVVREGRGAWPLAVTVTASLMVHRSAVVLLLPLAATALLWWRAHGAAGPGFAGWRSRVPTLAAFALPVVATLAFAPLLVASIRAVDARHLAPDPASPGFAGYPAAIAEAAFSPDHLGQVLNVTFQSAPFALAAPALAMVLAGPLRATRLRRVPRREAAVLGAFVLPALAILLFVHPRQGVFRDTDVFAPSLAALAVAGAALVGEALRGAGPRAWVGVPALACALFATLPSLSLAADVTRGLDRVRAYLDGPPRRPDEERALLWAFVGEREVGLGAPDRAVAAFERAVELAPSPRLLIELALAELDRRNYAGAQRAYARAAERLPGYTEAWLGLADASIGARDWPEAERALSRAAALEPGRREIAMIGRALQVARAREAATGATP